MANYSLTASQKAATLWGGGDQVAADEGAFFVATNPTPGTTIATTTSVVDDAATQSSTHAQASPVMVIQNTYSTNDPNAKNLYLKYLNMYIGQVPTSATSWELAIRSDQNAAPITTAGTVITPVNVNTGSGLQSKAAIQFGAITATIMNTSTGRLLARRTVNSAVPVTKDQWFFTFGNSGVASDQISGGTGAKNVILSLPPIVIAPGYNVRLEMWGASNAAAPAWEFELGYIERAAGL